ncbi:putative transcription factor & chromatin remodeling ARID family [Helianthus annuus]|uniref:Transcription factor & chromatin remodeling ARID family n=1 Tax=Helianthus annuus TaxID=4232 RepID=A0A9K3HMD1_HELAN|nr:putative transcription factor & chromatin remodeling ARID family [Helianthus annuus]KAJ0508321.1 putative transcription factor & chromatin remodeling ARID family [Helianthus annuus]KAJ0516602.1 putative transcription factor & chromatin remodeling ARID family [Helianthus annuus]KAJ0684603.1 putative transcription factor & chromatin remodeling ARID family [Helianthus annuus]
MVDWFLTKKLEISTRPVPAYASDNQKINLLELYLVVKWEGGHRNVTVNNLWVVVTKDMGFEYQDGEFMRLTYAMYLDILVYYYKLKSTQQRVHEKETVKNVVDVRRSRSQEDDKQGMAVDQMERNSGSDGIPDQEREHYAFFAGNDGME